MMIGVTQWLCPRVDDSFHKLKKSGVNKFLIGIAIIVVSGWTGDYVFDIEAVSLSGAFALALAGSFVLGVAITIAIGFAALVIVIFETLN